MSGYSAEELARAYMQLNLENSERRFAGSGVGIGRHMGNAQYISTNNMYPGVPRGSGTLIFNNLPQMQLHQQQAGTPFAYQYQSGPRGQAARNMNAIMQPIGGPFNGQMFGPTTANTNMGIRNLTPRPTPCDICGEVYAYFASLQNHRRRVHLC
ncbi:hypothetical protein DL98DRAFT_588646 [Cadophora sp. DSE1049]|nr:hypothetical protein DL98DRAFT_588646 [Cadophora sp. DSE1049]